MSHPISPDPYGEIGGSGSNPYSSPQLVETRNEGLSPLKQAKAKLRAPAILLAAVGALGMVGSIFVGVLVGVLGAAQIKPDPDSPIAGLLGIVLNPDAFIVHFISFFMNFTIIVAAFQMMQVKIRPICFIASIMALVNCATPSCVLGIPVGAWCLIVLSQPDVAKAFEENY